MTPTYRAFAFRLVGGGTELLCLRAGDVASIGRDAQNCAQLAHGSIEPFHARLRCDDWGVWLSLVPGATAKVGGETVVEERLVPPGASVELGVLRFELVGLIDDPVGGPAVTIAGSKTPLLGRVARRRLLALADRTIGFVVSAVLHASAFWLLHRLVVAQPPPHESFAIRSEVIDVPDRAYAATEPPLPATPELVAESLPDLEPTVESFAPDPAPRAASLGAGDDIELAAEVRTLGTGGVHGGEGMAGVGRLSLDGDVSGVGSAVVTRIQALRGVGVDLMIVVDTTSSMQPFLDQARTAADALVTTLATLVGDLRVGVVAYRDVDDEYTTRVLPLSADRYAILNFLWKLRAEGGGDVPEAVAAGLGEAIQNAGWRTRTHRVTVVIGDAPPHDGEWGRIKSMIGGFVRGDPKRIPGAIVSAIYTGPSRAGVRGEDDGAQAFSEIARIGRGDYLALAGPGDVRDRLVSTILGPHHASELRVLMSRVSDGPREAIVRQKIADGDKVWLLSKLRLPPVHPLVVDALREDPDQAVLKEARDLIADRGAPRESREAALYLLHREFPVALEIDLDSDKEILRPLLNRLDAVIRWR